jgi:hypothetical protein
VLLFLCRNQDADAQAFTLGVQGERPGDIVTIEYVRQRVGWLYRLRCIYLFASLLMLIVLLPFFAGNADIQGRIVGNLLNMFVLVAAVAAVGRSRVSFVIALLFTLPVLGFQFAGLMLDEQQYLVWSWGFGAAFYATTLSLLLRYVFSPDVMSADKLFGAASAYMLLGILWAYLYMILQHFYMGSFALHGSPVAAMTARELVYFSFTVLTTTGFGDIAPVLPHARSLVNLEQICGTLFVAILIARLAGIYPQSEEGGH